MGTVSRREFLKYGVQASAGLGILGNPLKSWASRTEYTPAIVIGSGFGGAIASYRLALAGISTLVLERGRRWPITPAGDTFATFDAPDGRAAWLSDTTTVLPPDLPIDVYTGVLELISFPGRIPNPSIISPNLDIRNGAGVGGGSLVYNQILLRPKPDVWKQVFPKIDYDEMTPYYEMVRAIINPSPVPADILARPEYLNYRVVEEQAAAAGFETRPQPLGIDWDVVREEYAGTRRPSAIAGQSWYGLNSGAAKSVDKNYLRMAEDTGHVQVLPLHMVTDIHSFRRFGLYVVSANEITTSGEVVGRRYFACHHLFMAAGSPNTTALLVRAKARGTLPGLSGQVGREWGTNGEYILVTNDLDRLTNPGTGGPAAHVVVEYPDNPDGPTSYAALTVPPPVSFVPGSSFVVGMGISPAVGRFRYDGSMDKVVVDWPEPDRRDPTFLRDPRLRRWEQSTINMRDALFAANNLQELFFSRGLTGHPLGGASMGGVCDAYGRVRANPGLYVVDGAFIPGSTAVVNPALTISAFAERSMEEIIAKDLT